jgi:succinate-semialdehyde dehydrogenase / glutarate-semialdehyde dehydrogenase
MTDYAVINPATGETLATYPTITDEALETVLEKADAAYRTWRDTPVAERAALIRRAAELHRERRDELAAIIVREMGKPLAAAEAESTSPPTSPSSMPTTPRGSPETSRSRSSVKAPR